MKYIILYIIVLAGCQKDQTTKPKQKTNTNDAKVVKTEKLETRRQFNTQQHK